jgi:hypothetical protein
VHQVDYLEGTWLVCYSVRKDPPLVFVVIQMNSLRFFPQFCCNICFNIFPIYVRVFRGVSYVEGKLPEHCIDVFHIQVILLFLLSPLFGFVASHDSVCVLSL